MWTQIRGGPGLVFVGRIPICVDEDECTLPPIVLQPRQLPENFYDSFVALMAAGRGTVESNL